MDSAIDLLFSIATIFYPISERCLCLISVLITNAFETSDAMIISHGFWIYDSSHIHKTPTHYKPILKFHKSNEEPFISLIRGSFAI